MSVETRLEALETGQRQILTDLGTVKEDVGEVKGTMTLFISSVNRFCDEKHSRVDARLESLEKRVKGDGVESHELRIQALEKQRTWFAAAWSVPKKVAVACGGMAAFVATVVGIIEAVQHL